MDPIVTSDTVFHMYVCFFHDLELLRMCMETELTFTIMVYSC